MTKSELLAALETMTVADQLEILEATSKIIRGRLQGRTELSIAAEKMRSYYEADNELTEFVDRNPEEFYEYSAYA
jgi:peptide methionine sulfoxide reductase MsrA